MKIFYSLLVRNNFLLGWSLKKKGRRRRTRCGSLNLKKLSQNVKKEITFKYVKKFEL